MCTHSASLANNTKVLSAVISAPSEQATQGRSAQTEACIQLSLELRAPTGRDDSTHDSHARKRWCAERQVNTSKPVAEADPRQAGCNDQTAYLTEGRQVAGS